MCEFIGTGLSVGTNKNVVNILRSLVEDENCVAYVPYDYIAAKTGREKDPAVHYLPKEQGRPMQIIDMVAHKERFNFSVKCLVDVMVEVQEQGSTELKRMKVWRNYNVVRDGQLVMDHIAAKLSKEVWEDYRKCGDILWIGDARPVNDTDTYDAEFAYTIRFTDLPNGDNETTSLPIVSSNWARPNKLKFHNMLLEASRLREQVKQAKKVLKENNIPAKTFESSDVYKENVGYGGDKLGTTAQCVTYTILENPGYKTPKFESSDPAEDLYRMNKRLADLDFRCACIKWALETSVKKNSYEWSDMFCKKAGSPRAYQEAIVDIDGTSYRLERCVYLANI